MFFIAGGPGQSALETFPQIAPAFAELRKKRDVILVDQRGTGESNPLVCKDAEGKTRGDATTTTTAPRPRALRRALRARRCRRSADLRFYTTTDAIHDLDDVREAIGAAQINLIGVSYGTRVAQQYAMRYPQHTRTIVLDGSCRTRWCSATNSRATSSSALDRQFERCAMTPACAKALGDPRAQLDALMAKLRADPPLVTLPRRDHRREQAGTPARRRTSPALVRMFAYAPQAVVAAAAGAERSRAGPLRGLMALSKMLGSTIGGPDHARHAVVGDLHRGRGRAEGRSRRCRHACSATSSPIT